METEKWENGGKQGDSGEKDGEVIFWKPEKEDCVFVWLCVFGGGDCYVKGHRIVPLLISWNHENSHVLTFFGGKKHGG